MQVDSVGQELRDGACHGSVGVRDDQLQNADGGKGQGFTVSHVRITTAVPAHR